VLDAGGNLCDETLALNIIVQGGQITVIDASVTAALRFRDKEYVSRTHVFEPEDDEAYTKLLATLEHTLQGTHETLQTVATAGIENTRESVVYWYSI